jgi:hypothetical protein
MNYLKTLDTYEQLPVSSEQTFPAAPFPRKHVHCVIDNLRDAVHAVYALRAAGYDAKDIHVMACWDFVEAVERAHQQKNGLSKLLSSIISYFDEGFGKVYLREARLGRHVLTVHLLRNEQLEQVRDLLASHNAHLIKYVDTWTVADLLPSRNDNT